MVGQRSDSTGSAFSQLIKAIQKDIASAKHAGEAAGAAGSYQVASRLFDQASKLDRILDNVRAAQRQWRSIREADRDRGKRRQRRALSDRLPRGVRTPESAFEVPILRALAERGGTGPVRDVLDRVGQMMAGHLKPVDLQPLPGDRATERWRNTAQWTRLTLVKRGLLDRPSPRGIWRLTDLGRQYLAELSRARADEAPNQPPPSLQSER